MAVSQNGWGVLRSPNSKYLHLWVIPSFNGVSKLLLRRGPAGLILALHCLWYAERIEPVAGDGDDFGWNPRQIPGSTKWSNHASGTAEDLNASLHPQHTHTFTSQQIEEIHLRLPAYQGTIRWGGDYRTSTDQMHWEIDADERRVRATAQHLLEMPRSKRLLRANPSQQKFL